MAALDDEGLRAEAAKMNLDVDPIPGDDLQTLVAGLYATPPQAGRAGAAGVDGQRRSK